MSGSPSSEEFVPGSDGFDLDFVHNAAWKCSNRTHDYSNAWSYIRSKSIFDSKFVESSHRFDAVAADPLNPNNAAAVPYDALLRAALAAKCHPPRPSSSGKKDQKTDGREVPPPLRGLVEVMDGVYDKEETFSQRLFHAIAKCFKEAGWDVQTILRAPTALSTEQEGVKAVVKDMVTGDGEGDRIEIVPNRQGVDGTAVVADDESDGKRVFDAIVLLGRREEGAFPSYSPSKYVVQIGGYHYTMGLCRTMEKDEYEPAYMKGGIFPDHSWVIFRKPKEVDEWQVHHVLAAVELTMNNMACRVYKLKEQQKYYYKPFSEKVVGVKTNSFPQRNDSVYRVDELFGPLGEALRNTVDLVRRGRAALGVGVPVELPLAVVTARRQGANPRKVPTCWTRGNLCTPHACGGSYGFNVEAFGLFHDHSGQEAASMYLDAMADGMVAAEIWLGCVADLPELPMPSPLSGRELKFGDRVLEGVYFVASPLTRHSGTLKISQGELYCGEVHLSRLQEDTAKSSKVVWFVDASAANLGTTHVMVKVSSDSTYGRLVEHGLLQTHLDSEYQRREIMATLRQTLAPSLYAIHTHWHGLVQIMPDLTKSGFHPLQPSTLLPDAVEAKKLWRAFRQQIDGVLLPLAEISVVHPDLRPGYNSTSNLLCNRDSCEIRMVDLDTLAFLRGWNWGWHGSDERIIADKSFFPSKRRFSSATEVVFAQVVVIAESWRKKVNDRDAVARDLFQESEWGEKWLNDESIQCDDEFVRSALDRIGQLYDS